MAIAYHVDENLYLNITNRCTAKCDFCLRRKTNGYGDASSLWLFTEPSTDEIVAAADAAGWKSAAEVVFCGFGEPTMRLEVMLEVAAEMRKQHPRVKLRLNTNGHGSLFAKRDITPELVIFNEVSVSLNYLDKDQYNEHCRPMFGIETFNGIVDFISNMAKHDTRVTITVISFLPPDEIQLAHKFANDMGVNIRIRDAER